MFAASNLWKLYRNVAARFGRVGGPTTFVVLAGGCTLWAIWATKSSSTAPKEDNKKKEDGRRTAPSHVTVCDHNGIPPLMTTTGGVAPLVRFRYRMGSSQPKGSMLVRGGCCQCEGVVTTGKIQLAWDDRADVDDDHRHPGGGMARPVASTTTATTKTTTNTTTTKSPGADHHGPTTTTSSAEQPQQEQKEQRQTTTTAAAAKMFKVNELYDWDDENPIGEGAFGLVFVATHKPTGDKVALKKIPKDQTDHVEFQREMRALERIHSMGDHPNICAMRESFDYQDNYYLVLDYVSGGELFEYLVNNGAFSEADAARLVREIASALAFLHGIGLVHADLKPENIMLSNSSQGNGVVKLVDFGSSRLWALEGELGESKEMSIVDNADEDDPLLNASNKGLTPAYCPPEAFGRDAIIGRPMDMWSLGIVLFIVLTGNHPFDMQADASEGEISRRISNPDQYSPPIRNSPATSHLSASSLDLIEKLLERDPRKRLTAIQMLEHPWVRGDTATTDIIAGSDVRLSKFRAMKSKLQRKFFQDAVSWSDNEIDIRRKTSLIEQSFQSVASELGANTEEGGGLSMSDFQDLLLEDMRNRFFPEGHVVYEENDAGHHMYFIFSGTVEVTTKEGSRAVRGQGDFFGEGALLNPNQRRSATIRCLTPVHAMEINRDYFEKYIAGSDKGLYLTLREKDKIRKRNRAKTILRLQNNLKENYFKKGQYLFKFGDKGDFLYIIDSGRVDILMRNQQVLSVTAGNLCGEHSLLTGRARNVSAICATDEGCRVFELQSRDFRKLLQTSPNLRDSILDLSRRREFKKAVVHRLNEQFPYHDPRVAFDAVDREGIGYLDEEAVGRLMREMNPEYTDQDIRDIIQSMDLSNSGRVTFEEFKKVFIGDLKTAASI